MAARRRPRQLDQARQEAGQRLAAAGRRDHQPALPALRRLDQRRPGAAAGSSPVRRTTQRTARAKLSAISRRRPFSQHKTSRAWLSGGSARVHYNGGRIEGGRTGLETLLIRLSAALLVGFILAAPASAQTAPDPSLGAASVPDLLRRALSAPSSKQLFAYDFEDVIEDKDGKRIVHGRVDPSRRKGDRVTITFLQDMRRKPADMKSTDLRYEKNADGDIFCDTRLARGCRQRGRQGRGARRRPGFRFQTEAGAAGRKHGPGTDGQDVGRSRGRRDHRPASLILRHAARKNTM